MYFQQVTSIGSPRELLWAWNELKERAQAGALKIRAIIPLFRMNEHYLKPVALPPLSGKKREQSNENGPTIKDPKTLAGCSTRQARTLLPFEQAFQLEVLPLGFIAHPGAEILSVATSQPKSSEELSEKQRLLQFITGRSVRLTPIHLPQLTEAIFLAYHTQGETLGGTLEKLKAQPNHQAEDRYHSEKRISDLPGTENEFLQALLKFALARKASDIHLVPRLRGSALRMRIDGQLLEHANHVCSPESHAAIVRRLKVLSRLDHTQREIPQDGSFSAEYPGAHASVRVSFMPTLHGEKIVLRLLGSSRQFSLNNFGLSAETTRLLQSALQKKSGLLLLCGPTGSGKTSALYALLGELSTCGLNIVSVEDPVESEIEGVAQTTLNPASGLTYPEALKGLLRQDPDVILIGEIRDRESASLALQASTTGHLVLSSVHAAGVIQATQRLLGLALPLPVLSQSLQLILSLRLLPQLCGSCKVVDLKAARAAGFEIFQPVGCSSCDYSGYAGRTPIEEHLVFDSALRELLSQDQLTQEALSRQSSAVYRSLKTDAREQLARGTIGLRDYLRIISE